MNKIQKLKNRQLAKFLTHLKKTGQLTPELEKDIKRAYRFTFEDIEALLQGHDQEFKNEGTSKQST
jgi:hypothetical protein